MRNYHSREKKNGIQFSIKGWKFFLGPPGGEHRTPPMGAAGAAVRKTDSLIELTEYNDRYLGLMYIYVISFSISAARVVFLFHPLNKSRTDGNAVTIFQENNMAAICYYYLYKNEIFFFFGLK